MVLFACTSEMVAAADNSTGRVPAESPGVKRGDFDPALFNSWGELEKLKFILEMLELRDRSLENFSCKVQQSTTNFRVRDGGGRHFGYRQDWELKRLGPKYWLKRIEYEHYPPDSVVREVWLTNWDGAASRTMPAPESPKADHFCNIRPVENHDAIYDHYNELLGFRTYAGNDRVAALIDFLRDASKPDRELRIWDEQFKGMHAIHMRVQQGDDRWDFWLDPARAYLVERSEWKSEQGAAYNSVSGEVRAAEQVAGVWVPRKVVCVSGTSASEEATEMTYEATSLQLGQVTEQDMRLTIPKDARVFDTVRKIAYEPLANRKYKLLPIEDEQRVLHVPPRDAIVDRIDDDTPGLYSISQDLPLRLRG